MCWNEAFGIKFSSTEKLYLEELHNKESVTRRTLGDFTGQTIVFSRMKKWIQTKLWQVKETFWDNNTLVTSAARQDAGNVGRNRCVAMERWVWMPGYFCILVFGFSEGYYWVSFPGCFSSSQSRTVITSILPGYFRDGMKWRIHSARHIVGVQQMLTSICFLISWWVFSI